LPVTWDVQSETLSSFLDFDLRPNLSSVENQFEPFRLNFGLGLKSQTLA